MNRERPAAVTVSPSRGWKAKVREVSFLSAMVSIVPELLFCLLPLLVLSLTLIFVDKSIMHLLASPEWSFASAILLGQAVVRFVFGATSNRRAKRKVAALIVAAIIVLELVPALAVLSFTIISHENLGAENVPGWLVGLQLFLFLMSILTFVAIGGVGEAITETSGNED
jgi:hypothetical protein